MIIRSLGFPPYETWGAFSRRHLSPLVGLIVPTSRLPKKLYPSCRLVGTTGLMTYSKSL